jgi:hypothetical protein
MLTSRIVRSFFVLILFYSACLLTQMYAQQQSPSPAPQNSLLHVPAPPSDPLELATVPHDVPAQPQARAAVLSLIELARKNADIRAEGTPPFDLRMSFSATGEVLYTGSGETEDTWVSWKSSRWSARLGDFTMTRIWDNGVSYDDKPMSLIPLRLQMLRDAVFWPMRAHPDAQLRIAKVDWKGKQVTCILSAGPGIQAQEIIGRRWVEREYCIDSKSGLLQILSDAPGIYVVYDYTGAIDFHGHTMPRQISIFEGGKNVLEAHVDQLTEASNIASGLLTPTADMVQDGPVLSGALRFPQSVSLPAGAATLQPVIVHALLAHDGKVLDAELLDDSGADLEKSALDIVKHSTYRAASRTQLQREAFINVKFVSR